MYTKVFLYNTMSQVEPRYIIVQQIYLICVTWHCTCVRLNSNNRDSVCPVYVFSVFLLLNKGSDRIGSKWEIP